MNGWEQYGIDHSSVSQINTIETNPALWLAEKVFKIKRPASSAMYRGIVTEDAVAATLLGAEMGASVKAAEEDFDTRVGISVSEKDGKERAGIAPMTAFAVDELKGFGEPEFDLGDQRKVEMMCNGDGWKLPIIGFLDFVYPKHGLVVDLKTTMRLPSKMSEAHRRQRCFYQKCSGDNQSVKFLYVTPKKFGWLEDGDVAEELALMKAHLNAMEKFLSISADKEYLASIMPVDPTHFFWHGSIDERKRIFGR